MSGPSSGRASCANTAGTRLSAQDVAGDPRRRPRAAHSGVVARFRAERRPRVSSSYRVYGLGHDRSPDRPRSKHPQDGFPAQGQEQPGLTADTTPSPDHGEGSLRRPSATASSAALITGRSRIGRTIAIAYAREGADVAIAHLPEEAEDAIETLGHIDAAGRRGIALASDVQDEDFASSIVDDTITAFGGIDIVVLDAAYQKDRDSLDSLSTSDWTACSRRTSTVSSTRPVLPSHTFVQARRSS